MKNVPQKKIDFFSPVKDEFPVAVNHPGEIGIEIEVEGRNLPQSLASYWAVHKEGSLRGESAEYVLKKPTTRINVKAYLTYLVKALAKAESKCVFSPRTSVHVHINMNKFTMVQVYNYIICYLIIEDLLTQYAGPNRVGNVFCLRAHDAEWFIDWLTERAKTTKFCPEPEEMRYTSVNVCAIPKFNSLEFRALRGTLDIDIINNWIKMLLSLKDVAVKYTDPREIIGDFSRLGPSDFLAKLLPNHAEPLKAFLPDWENKLWDATRLVQEVAFSQDWKPTEKKKGGRIFVAALPEEKEDEPEWDIDG